MEKDVKTLKILLGVIMLLIIIVLSVSVYFFFFRTITCQTNDESCFSKAIINCERSSFVRESNDFTLSYIIQGPNGDKCVVYVSIVTVKKGSAELSSLEGKSMSCEIQKGLEITNPETDIKNCHGLLKEAMQEIIIQKMHSQLVENIGLIENATKVL